MPKNYLPETIAFVLLFLAIILAVPLFKLSTDVYNFSETIHHDFKK